MCQAVTTARLLCCGLAVRACCAVCVRLARARTRSLNWMNRSRVPRARARARRVHGARARARRSTCDVMLVQHDGHTGTGHVDQPLLLAHAHHRCGIVLVAVGALRRGAVAAAIGRRPRIFLLPAQTCVERHVFVCVCVFVSSSSSMTTLPPPPLPPPLQLAELGHACARVRRSKSPCQGMARGAPSSSGPMRPTHGRQSASEANEPE